MVVDIFYGLFEWDSSKEKINCEKHGIDFKEAVRAFTDPKGLLARDEKHSAYEERWIYVGRLDHQIVTIWFTQRGGRIRLIGAGSLSKGRRRYENENKAK